MLTRNNKAIIELSNHNYVPVVKDSAIYYGGSQMWFSTKNKHSKDYILHNYGCGTIATADLFLYLSMQNVVFRTPESEIALGMSDSINYINYDIYVRMINDQYTKTRKVIAVLGPKIASAFNSYSKAYGLGLFASWKWKLSYYDMYEIISEMLSADIPVILSIGPNTPLLWGKKGIPFYQQYDIKVSEDSEPITNAFQRYRYKAVTQPVNGHYVTVTGIIKDDIASAIMLRISSWGKQYYINYEEYRNYIENSGDTFTSSLVYIKQ